ncbi:MAG: site-specific integrase [Oscillospiraceae bacterium]
MREKTIFTDEQVDTLLDCLVSKGKYMQAAVFALGIASGARKSELARFKTDYFSDENIVYNSLWRTPEMKTKGRGSRGKMLKKFVIIAQFKPYLDLWMKQREELGIDSEWLFVYKDSKTNTWEKLKSDTMNSWAITFSKILGINFYWHSLRHLFVTRLMQANIPAEVVKDIVGWADVSLISVYNDSDISDELGKYFDENGVKDIKQGSLSQL